MTKNRDARASNSGSGPQQESYPSVLVKNFGPIAKGGIDLRPLTVFAGPSNTGKSWMATLVYGLRRSLRIERNTSIPQLISTWGGRDTYLKKFPENATAWLDSIAKGRPLLLTDSEKEIIKAKLVEERLGVDTELRRCFGFSQHAHFIREGNVKHSYVTVTTGETEEFTKTRYSLKFSKKDKSEFNVEIPSDYLPLPTYGHRSTLDITMRLQEILSEVDDEKDESNTFGFRSPRSALLEQIIACSLGDLGGSVFYLPADRGGIIHAHSVVVSALIQSASRVGLSPMPSLPGLSGVLADFLGGLIDMATRKGQTLGGMFNPFLSALQNQDQTTPEKDDLAKRLEDNLLHGHVGVDSSSENYPRFTIRPKKWDRDLPLMNASSMVSELSPVVLYLRNLVNSGDLLIVEEPESHLHPAMQVNFVQELATCVQRGIWVLLTTHSEWVLDELANIVARGEADESRCAKYPALPKKKVGLWLFDYVNEKNRASGSQIREIDWDPEEGGFDVNYDTVSMKLHNAWVDLMRDSDE